MAMAAPALVPSVPAELAFLAGVNVLVLFAGESVALGDLAGVLVDELSGSESLFASTAAGAVPFGFTSNVLEPAIRGQKRFATNRSFGTHADRLEDL